MKEEVKIRINKHRELASKILEKYPQSRNNDWDLLLLALIERGINIPFSIRQNIKNSGINFHSLLRERQKLQSEGKFIPTNIEVIKRRKISEEVYKEHYSKN